MLDTDVVVVAVSNDDMRPTALVKSVAEAFSSTLSLRLVNWPACTADPIAPVAPSPRLTTD